MPDGSIVTLAQNSRISFPEHYRGHRRTASLNGTAFFNITRDATAPFTVQSGDLDVKVLGTSFEVEATKTGYEASVTVLTGKVQVNCDNRKLAVLESNQQVRYDKFSKQPNIIQQMDAAAKTGWTKKQLVFNETPLAVVVKTLQVYYGMKITILDHVLKADDTFSGSFDRNETRKEVLDVICFSSGLTYSVTKDSTIIIRK
jgi:ferric-dicitrate binding protein FerR (iron transport regulator)